MEKINFVNNSEPYLSAENLNQMQSNIENGFNYNLTNIKSTVLSVTSSNTNQVLVDTTIKDAGTYLFIANVPVNYYGTQTGRDLFVNLLINNTTVLTTTGIINSEVYTLTRPIIYMGEIQANSSIKIISNGGGKNYRINEFTLQYIKLK